MVLPKWWLHFKLFPRHNYSHVTSRENETQRLHHPSKVPKWVGGLKGKLMQQFWMTMRRSQSKLNICMSFEPGISFLWLYPIKILLQESKNKSTKMSTEALFIIQAKYLFIGTGFKKSMVQVYHFYGPTKKIMRQIYIYWHVWYYDFY